MPVVLIVLSFLAGLLICNAVPHLVSGLRGEAFPTPFARPPGAGLSAPLVDVMWGWWNLFLESRFRSSLQASKLLWRTSESGH
jgi:hypothetical protein